ncbi:MAG: polysaccharide biosynthesis tyrosine autokinase [Actinomycetota bacterium]|nr:polysaccharide biosynthesis tyrosine autokinase [Actinomycetota bacterium]
MVTPVQDRPSVFDIRYLVAVFLRGWKIIALCAVVAVVLGYAWSSRQTPQYQASAVVSLNPIVAVVNSSGSVSSAEVQTQIQILASSATAELVTKKLGQPVEANIALLSPQTSNILITGYSTSPEIASETANAYAEVFGELVKTSDLELNASARTVLLARLTDVEGRLRAKGENPRAASTSTLPDVQDMRSQQRTYQQQLSSLGDSARFIEQGRVEVLDPAVTPTSPFAPNNRRTVLLSLLMGVLLGVGIVFGREHFNDVVKGVAEFEATTGGLPILGFVPLDRDWGLVSETHLAVLEAPTSGIAESYRGLRTALQYIRVDTPVHVMQVTSPLPQDGKTTTVANLAVALALTGRSVLLIDLDLRRPRLHTFFGLSNDTGFTTYLADLGTREQAIVAIDRVEGLCVLPSGPIPSDPSELLESGKTRELLTELGTQFDLILVDSPPILGLSDALVISTMVDTSVLVARSGMVTKRDLRAAVEQMRKVNAPLVGAVVNSVDTSKRDAYSYYGYGYGTYYGKAYGYNRSNSE